MTRKRSLSDEERTLWHTVTRAIKPLHKRKVEAEQARSIATPLPNPPPQGGREQTESRTTTSRRTLGALPSPLRGGVGGGGPSIVRDTSTTPLPNPPPQGGREQTERGASPPPSPRRAPAPLPLSPIDRRTVRKLARGSAEIDGRIDLHGLTQAEAHAVLHRFLQQAQARDAKLVLVITGKGGGADPHSGRGVLKRQVPMWLESAELRPLVVGFESAAIGHGGQGALYVRVRRGR